MNLVNLNVTELYAQEKVSVDGGNWGNYLFDLFYGNGGADVIYESAFQSQ